MNKAFAVVVLLTSALPVAAMAQAPAATQATVRDGSHDFDFNVGTWRTHLVRLKEPLTGSKETVALDGTVTIAPFWGGQGLYEQIEADGPDGHWQGMTVFLYNPASGQWSQRFASAVTGRFDRAMYGGFKDGRGELVTHDSYRGRAIMIRARWLDIKPDSHTYEESLSDDGGKTWQAVITAKLTRIAPVAPPSFPPSTDGAHDFDFDLGLWRTRSTRLLKPLTGSTQWVDMAGTTNNVPLWGGRANLAFFNADGSAGHLELIALRLFDPVAKQWNINFATRGSGVWSVPMIGSFKDGQGTFYDQEEIGGRMVLVRFRFVSFAREEVRSEQAFSADNGKTWETNWINRYSFVSPPDRAASAPR